MHGTPNAVRRGKGDNPKSPQTLTNKQKRRSILITLTHKSHFDFRFVLAGVGRGGRNIMFGGASSLCPSDASGADHPADDDEVGEEGEVDEEDNSDEDDVDQDQMAHTVRPRHILRRRDGDGNSQGAALQAAS